MAYFAPYIDSSGFHMPTYSDIRDDLIAKAKSIFGQDIYLGIDSQDYQWISSFSNMIYDSFLTAQLAYNNRSPLTAIGSALDTVIKINGLKRDKATYSTCPVTLVGTPGTTISNGVAKDVNGVKWDLPATVLISALGTASSIVKCEQPGPISVSIGDIQNIENPTLGWASISNPDIATLGTTVEPDSVVRSRQAISTALPSRTILEGTKAAIAALSGVTRSEVYENDTFLVDSNGLPAHSITAVVEGGQDADIAQAIFNKKGGGCYTNGTTSVSITDIYGQVSVIRFYRLSYNDIDVVVNVKALQGYTSSITDSIKASLANYLNSVAIGDDLSVSSLWGTALSSNLNLAKPNFSITSLTAAKHGDAQGTSDIITAFNEATRGDILNIMVNVS